VIQENNMHGNPKLVVFDDDPTGIQTVHDCKVLTAWDKDTVKEALADRVDFFYILTNIRAFPPQYARQILDEAARTVRTAAQEAGYNVEVLARSDSTLRSHFPLEVELFSEIFQAHTPADAIIFAPAFFESGRLTVNDIHYVVEGAHRIPADKTEFARDPDFSYSTAYLPAYIEEKMCKAHGDDRSKDFSAQEVASIPLDMIRSGGMEAVEEFLMQLHGARFVLVNSEAYSDLDIVTAAIRSAVGRGKRFLYHTSSSFVRSMMQQQPHRIDFSAAKTGPGVIVAGSYVNKTERQIKRLLDSPAVSGIPVPVEEIVHKPQEQKRYALQRIHLALAEKKSALLYLQRSQRPAEKDQGKMRDTGQKITEFFCRCIGELEVEPAFVLAKGGITSHEVLKKGLKVASARVAGQVLPGVPAIQMESGHRFAGMYYVIFPGNVGTDETLAQAVALLQGSSKG